MATGPSYTSPYAPNHLDTAYRIADLMGRQGGAVAQAQAQEARAKAARTLSVANLIGNVGGLVGDVFARNEDAQRAAAENQAIADVVASGKPVDASEIIRRVGATRAKEIIPLIEAAQTKREAAETKTRETASRQAFAQRIIDDPNSTPEQRNAATYWAGTGTAAPASLLPDPKAVAEAAEKAAAARKAENEAGMRRMIVDAKQAGATPAQITQLGERFVAEIGKDPSELLVPKPEKLTISEPKPYRLNGETVMLGRGSDNKMYDAGGKPVEVEAASLKPYVAPSTAQGPQQPWQWVKRGDQEVYTNRVQPGDVQKGAAAQRPTEEMGKASGFYVQMKDAMGVLDEMEPSITPAELYQIQTLPQDGVFGYLNRNDVSENAKRYLRAFEQYTEARLRSVSGAAISDKEYERDRRTYAKQYGETPKLSADRLRARGGALDALRRRAGSALDDADLGGGGGGAGTVLGTGAFSVAANGKTYRFETQAKLDEFKRKAGLP